MTALGRALLVADPDLARTKTALRAMLASALSALLLWMIASRAGLPATGALMGASLAMFATALARDATPRAQRITSLLLPLPAAAAIVLAAFAAPRHALNVALFVVAVSLAVGVRRFGPRPTALATLGFQAFFFAELFQAAPADLPWLLAAAAIAAAVAWAVRFGLVPDRPERQIVRSKQAFRAILSLVLDRSADAMKAGWSMPSRRRLQWGLARANETALSLEELVRVSRPTTGEALRERVFELEIAMGRVVSAARVATVTKALPPDGLRALNDALREASALPSDESALRLHLDRARAACAASPEPAVAEVQVHGLETALGDLLRLARPGSAGRLRAPAADGPPAAPEPPVTGALHPSTRQAIQAAVAAALAIGIGSAISTSRWFWAVLAVFVVLTKASTTAEIAVGAWRRSIGTILGVPVGMLFAAALHGHPRVELVALFLCIFVAFWFLAASQAVTVGAITAGVALLYSLQGRYSPDLLVLRIVETIAGATIGAVVGRFVLPSPTANRVKDAWRALLEDLATWLEGVADRPDDVAARFVAIRGLDRRVRELRAAAEPLTRGVLPLAPTTVEAVHGAFSLVFNARQLAAADLVGVPGVVPIARQLAGNARALANGAAITSVDPLLKDLRGAVADDPGAAAVLYALRRLDDTMIEIAQAMR